MELYTIVIITIMINMVMASVLFIYSVYVIFKYLLQVDLKLFVILHYVFAVPLLLIDVIMPVALYFELSELNKDKQINFNDLAIPKSFYAIMGVLHDIFYIGLILQMICGLAQVSTSLGLLLNFGEGTLKNT